MSRVRLLCRQQYQARAIHRFRSSLSRSSVSFLGTGLLVLALGACGGPAEPPDPAPSSAAPPPGSSASSPGSDGVGASAGYKYRFRMTSPGNDNFAITEREVYLYFWPDTSRVTFRLQNRQGTQIRILWDQCRFITTEGIAYTTIHEGITYEQRNFPQTYTIVPGQGQYNDWIAPVELMEDPTAAAGGGLRLLFPTDVQATAFRGKTFSVTFVLEIDNVPRTYRLQFEIENVSPPE